MKKILDKLTLLYKININKSKKGSVCYLKGVLSEYKKVRVRVLKIQVSFFAFMKETGGIANENIT